MKCNLHCTVSCALALMVPSKFSALQVYWPSSSGLTSWRIRAPLDSTTWRPTGSVEFTLNHVTLGGGFPAAVHFKMAVRLALIVVSTGGCNKEGAEMDCPGAPFSPGGPLGPTGPGRPCSPRSPFIPIGPCGPIDPLLPVVPAGPDLPLGPVIPWGPRLPRLPVLSFGPGRQSFSSLAQILFCNRRSSFLISLFTSEAFVTDLFWEASDESRFSLYITLLPWKMCVVF